MKSVLDRHYLKSDPSLVVRVEVPSRVTLWVPKVIDMEDEDFAGSRVYVAIDDAEKASMHQGTPLMFEMLHMIYLDAGQSIWACTRDQALIGIQIDTVN
jgi:hypothetical protein